MPDPKPNAAQQILEQAICLEADSEAFCRQAAAATADAGGGQMFLELADQEALHQAIIRRQMDSLAASGRWAADERIHDVTCDLSQSLFPQGAAPGPGRRPAGRRAPGPVACPGEGEREL